MVSKNLVKNLKFLLIPLLFGVVYLYQIQGDLVFFPKAMQLENRKAFSDHEIAVFRDGEILRGWFFNNLSDDNKRLVVIYGDGDQELSSLLPISEKFGDYSVLMVNYRGYGESSGKPNQNKLISDALDTLDQLCNDKKIDYRDVTLYGHGLGIGIAAVIAHYRDVGSLILSAPFDSMVSVIESKQPYMLSRFMLQDHFSAITVAPGMELPTYIAIADSDDRYLPKHAQKLLARWKGDVTEKSYQFNRFTILNEETYWNDISRFIESNQSQTSAKPINKLEFQSPTQIIYVSDLEESETNQ